MFYNMSADQAKKGWQIISFIGRFLKKHFSLWLFSIYLYWMPIFMNYLQYDVRLEELYIQPITALSGFIAIFLMYYSLCRLTTVYNTEFQERFLHSEEKITALPQRLKFILSQKENRIELGVLAALFIILPGRFTNPYAVYLLTGSMYADYSKFKLTALMLPVALIVFALANLSATKYWDTVERSKEQEKLYKNQRQQANDAKREKLSFTWKFGKLLIIYFIGGMAFLWVLPYIVYGFIPMMAAVLDPRIFLILLVIILLPLAIRNTRALIKRRRFFKRLYKISKEKKMHISKVKYPYRSVLTSYNGESFSIRTNGKTYSCKLLCQKKRNDPLYIMGDGQGAIVKKIRALWFELFSYTTSFNFGWESEHKKVLIINPTPKKIFVPKGGRITEDKGIGEIAQLFMHTRTPRKILVPMGTKNDMVEELDNGDIIGGYEIYTATAFLNALERDVIDID